MKRAGFTMIELIFVIVILGILAAVAVPKLAATRTDAEVAKMSTNVATVISDIGSYYTSQGTLGANWSDMTNVALEASSGTKSTVTSGAAKLFSGTTECVAITMNGAVADGNITVTTSNTGTPVCGAVNTKIDSMKKTHVFGGVGVK